jgi:ABC-type amino acid transport substrate-binding protein
MTVRAKIISACVFTFMFFSAALAHADSSLLTPEENLWLRQRNNTIVVYPEQNNPPFSYQSASGVIEGLSVDYIELIAEKIGATVQYLTPRSRNQIITDATAGKGDVILTLTPNDEREKTFVFTESYITVPFVIVVRKDAQVKSTQTLADYNGKRIALVEGSAIEMYVRQNYPRVVVEDVTDDEAALQQVVLGQVDAATMDIASLSYLLSKQVLSSVKMAGMVGYSGRPSFAMTKNKEILQSILEKGLTQISAEERQILTDKWVSLPKEKSEIGFFQHLQSGTGMLILYVLFAAVIVLSCIVLLRRRVPAWRHFQKTRDADKLHEELHELEAAQRTLSEELGQVQHLEADLEEKLKKLNE